MKQNTIVRRNGRRSALVIAAIVLLAAVATGLAVAFGKLRSLWLEQCAVTDVAMQVKVNSGKLVKGDVVAETLGLKDGANTAEIDFAERRDEVLKRYPAIRDLTITRHMPNRVEITVVEREPMVRMNLRGVKADSGRVADSYGVVFQCRRGTGLLPIIREAGATGTAPGRRLQGRALGALALAEAFRLPDYQEMGALEFDISKPDYIAVTLGDYSTAKIAWSGMDAPSEATRAELMATLTNLRDAIRSNVAAGVKTWIATSPDTTYADTKERIQ